MKLPIILAIAALGLVGTANAQRHHMGVKGGLNVFTMRDGNTTPFYYRAGFHAGVYSNIRLWQRVAMQPELVYSTQGSDLNTRSGVRRTSLNYLNVPILAQYQFPSGLRLQTGPQVGFLTGARSEIKGEEVANYDDFRKVDIAAVFGIAYIHRRSGLGADARFNFGLREVNWTNPIRTFNHGFQVGLIYQFMN